MAAPEVVRAVVADPGHICGRIAADPSLATRRLRHSSCERCEASHCKTPAAGRKSGTFAPAATSGDGGFNRPEIPCIRLRRSSFCSPSCDHST